MLAVLARMLAVLASYICETAIFWSEMTCKLVLFVLVGSKESQLQLLALVAIVWIFSENH